jgi:hypothetical protein
MIGIQKALQIAKNQARRLAVEHVGYTCAVGRYWRPMCFRMLICRHFINRPWMAMPAGAKIWERAAGTGGYCGRKSPLFSVGAGQCSKIMTGARVPECADLVFKVEDSELLPDGKYGLRRKNEF